MSLLFMDGFDHYTISQITRKWNVLLDGAGNTISLTTGRNGTGNALRFNGTASQWYVNVDSQGIKSTVIMGFAMNITSMGSGGKMIAFCRQEGGITMNLFVNADATISIQRYNGNNLGTSSSAISLGVWNYIEWKMTPHTSAGANTNILKINGANVLTLSGGTNTRGDFVATNGLASVGIGSPTTPGNTTFDVAFDDFYLIDTAGSVNNDFLGDVRVQYIKPTGAGNATNWTPNTGTNYAAVDDSTPDDDTTYVSTSTTSTTDLYVMEDLTYAPAGIMAVQPLICAKKMDGGSRTIAPVFRHSSTDADGTAQGATDGYSYLRQIHEVNPVTGLAWTGSDINNIEFGAKLVT